MGHRAWLLGNRFLHGHLQVTKVASGWAGLHARQSWGLMLTLGDSLIPLGKLLWQLPAILGCQPHPEEVPFAVFLLKQQLFCWHIKPNPRQSHTGA